MSSRIVKHALVIATLMAAAAPALGADCPAVVSSGSAAHPQNYDPPKHYDVETLATLRAISAWQAQARTACPGASALWTQASNRSIVCDGYTGGLSCEASATPGG